MMKNYLKPLKLCFYRLQRHLFSYNNIMRYILVLLLTSSSPLFLNCGGGGSGSSDTTGGTDTADPNTDDITPTVTLTVEYGVKNPITDLGACVESVFACLENGSALKDCFGTQVIVCTGEEPTDGCCMQLCGDQLAQKLDSGTSEHEALLEVFVYDGTCMPNIAEVTNQ
jgi:hypothetical protein